MYNTNNEHDQDFRVRKPKQNEVLGIVDAMLGTNKLRVVCQDDKIRTCRIPGRMRKRIWIREGDVVLVEPWQIQGDKSGDIILKYTDTQVGWLRRKGILKMNL
jgi:translation initiation factor 1A